jgi:hypothetical protein
MRSLAAGTTATLVGTRGECAGPAYLHSKGIRR